jgi:hypothetical protein
VAGLTTERTGDALFAAALRARQAGRHADEARLLAQAGRSGHAGAIGVLGLQLMSGRGVPADPARGLRLAWRAADLGDGPAAAIIARVLASGAVGPRDWPGGLDYLQRAAEAGDEGAQGQLRLLADPSGAAPPRTWAELRRSVDLDAWRATTALRPVCADPEIRAAEGVLTPAVCDWIMQRARGRLVPAPVLSNQLEGEVRKAIRTNSLAGFDLMTADLVILAVRERLAAHAGLDVQTFEAPQALHYAPGQAYLPHFDFLDPVLPGHSGELGRNGQRHITLLAYLNDGYEGGETDFPRLGVRHKGRTGGLLMFRNLTADGRPDRRMLHAGLPPTSGEKWLLSQWVRDRAQP